MKIKTKGLIKPMAICTLIVFSVNAFAQLPKYYETERSNEGNVLMLQFEYGYNFPAGDMADRFDPFNSAGGGVDLLTQKNWLIGLKSHYMFGNTVNENVLANLQDSVGLIYGENGGIAEVQLRMRGIYIGGHIGRVFPLDKEQRSGIRATFGAGFFQHKIRIQDDPLVFVPFLSGDYEKGYDRLTNGLALTQFIGYEHLGKLRRVNFFAGLEISEAFTKSRRNFDFDTRSADTASRTDISIGFRFGWTLPFYIGENADDIEY